MSEAILPAGWASATINQILMPQDDGKIIHQGWSPQCHKEPAEEGEWGVLKTTAIQDGYFLDVEHKKLPRDKEPKPRIEVKEKDLLLTNAGPRTRCGVATLVRKTRTKLMISGKMYRMRFDERYIVPELIESWLRTSRSQDELNTRKTGISESGLNMTQDRFKTLPVVIPPLAEQQQIAAKLDELLAQVDTIKTRLDAIPPILKRFRQSVLTAAVSGRLTEEWRDKQGIDSWDSKPLSEYDIDIQIGPFGSLLHKSDYVMGGVSLVNPMHIVDGKIQTSKSMTVNREKILELKRYKLIKGDIVLGRRGEMGRAAVVGDEEVICGTGSLFLRPNTEQYESHFLRMFLASPETVKYLESGSVGSTMTNLNQKILKSMPVPSVSKYEQTEIVRRVEQLFTFADQIGQRIKDAQSRVNHLTQSILAKAFRGELTAEWREQNPDLISGENSAEVLLERIKTERPAAKPTKPQRKRRAA